MLAGSDFARSHESCLFHIIGAKDAFLQEINAAYKFGLDLHEVRERTLEESLKAIGQTSPALNEIQKLLKDDASWLAIARELRDHGTHRANIPHSFILSTSEGPQPPHFRNPKDGTEITQNIPDFLALSIAQMRELITRLRATLPP